MNDTRRCGVLFADIAGNTALHQRLGDAAAVRLIQDLVGRMTVLVAEHGGRVIKSDGDDILAVFERPQAAADAANAAVALQLAAHDRGLALYVGMHCGTVEFREVLGRPDVLGQAVNLAARLHKLVPDAPGHIFLAAECRAGLPPELASRTEPFGTRQLKGIGEVEVHTLQWREGLTTVLPTRYAGAPVREALPLRLVLHHGDSAHTLGAAEGAVLIGRAKDAFLRLNDPELKVSSSHLRLELRAGGWFALDRSRNGTWLADAATGEETLLLGTDAPLPRRGALCLGRRFAEDAAGHFTLRFETLA